MSNFGLYSRYYDLLYRDKDYSEESDYIEKQIKKYGTGVNTILELGCGTGEHAINLASKGFKISGVDISQDMLDRAKVKLAAQPQNIQDKIDIQQCDIRHLQKGKQYDCLLSLFHVMSYQTGNQDIEAVLDVAYRHLSDEGIFIFDCWYGPAVLSEKPEVRIKVFEDNDIHVTRIAEPELHPNSNIVDVNYTVFIREKNSNITDVLNEKHRMRYLFYPEIELFAQSTGFSLVNSEEWLTGREPGVDSWGVCFVLKK